MRNEEEDEQKLEGQRRKGGIQKEVIGDGVNLEAS